MTLYFTGYSFQYFVFNLFLTKLSGNKFANAAIFGGAETISVFASGWLMKKMADTTIFQILFYAGMISYVIFIFFPDVNSFVIYFANCCFVGSMGAW